MRLGDEERGRRDKFIKRLTDLGATLERKDLRRTVELYLFALPARP